MDLSVFGIPLGAPFGIPECEKVAVGTLTVYQQPTAVCYERLGSQEAIQNRSAVENESILIRYPAAEAPAVMNGGMAVGVIKDRILQGVRFNTRGVEVQDQVLAALREKFGNPGSTVPKQVQNTLGSTYDVLDAKWTSREVEILFRGVTSRVDTGFLGISMKQAVAPQQPASKPAGDEP
jgi:hypothetical protein